MEYLSKISKPSPSVTEVIGFLRPSAEVPRHYEKQVLITNTLSFIFFFVTFGIIAAFYILFGWITALPLIILVAAAFFVIPFVNRLNHSIGRTAFCLIPVWLTMVVTIYMKLQPTESLSYIFYFDSRFILMASTILPGIVFRLEDRVPLFVCLGSTSLLLYFYDPIHNLFGAGYYQNGFTEQAYRYINYIVVVTYTVLLFGIVLLRSVLERSERNLLSQNFELVEKQNEIEAQHEELLQHQEEMLASTEKLEQANTLILDQQKKLEEYNETLEALVEEKSADLIKTNNELVKYNNELLQFSYTVSHNLRGPVARILGLARLLNHSGADVDKEQLQDMILKSSVELDDILKDLSLIIDIRNDLYRIREKVYLQDEWHKAVSMLGENIKSVYQLDVDFSKAPYIYAVRPMVQSIFYNLFSNAIKYQSPDRKLKVKVFSERLPDSQTVIEISDNGMGIDLKSYKNNLFKLYKRFHHHVPGKGLGLYLVKTQVETLGGTIEVDSDPTSGTTFRVIFTRPEEVEKQVAFESDAVQIYYDGQTNVIVIVWKRPVTSEEYRQTHEILINSTNVYRSPGLINDIRLRGPITEQDQTWFAENVIPELVKSGPIRVAVVSIDDRFHNRTLEHIVTETHASTFDLRSFDSLESSLEWIKKEAQVLN
jgi:signal transduction histidine kinase